MVSCVTVAESVRLPFPLNMLPGKLLPGQQQGMNIRSFNYAHSSTKKAAANNCYRRTYSQWTSHRACGPQIQVAIHLEEGRVKRGLKIQASFISSHREKKKAVVV